MERQLENALASFDTLPTEAVGIIGTWALDDTPQLVADSLSVIAKQTGAFDPYPVFLKRFTVNPDKPKEPAEDDPRFIPHKTYSDPDADFLRRVETANNYLNALEIHEKALQGYQKEAADTDYIRSTFNPNLRDYLRYSQLDFVRNRLC